MRKKHAIDIMRFSGLKEALEEFNPINILSYIPDRSVPGVYMFKIEFQADGLYGLAIYCTERKVFIEEPGTLDDYGFNGLSELYSKYPNL